MRIYEVNFSHTKHGESYDRELVAVLGFVPEAIKKALSRRNGDRPYLRVESVRLIASAS